MTNTLTDIVNVYDELQKLVGENAALTTRLMALQNAVGAGRTTTRPTSAEERLRDEADKARPEFKQMIKADLASAEVAEIAAIEDAVSDWLVELPMELGKQLRGKHMSQLRASLLRLVRRPSVEW